MPIDGAFGEQGLLSLTPESFRWRILVLKSNHPDKKALWKGFTTGRLRVKSLLHYITKLIPYHLPTDYLGPPTTLLDLDQRQ